MPDTIIFLMNGWDSAAGGIQTVNRELSIALTKVRPDLRCVVLVTIATDAEASDAFTRGIELIRGGDPNDWSSALLSPELDAIDPGSVLAVVGHSVFSGRQALILRDRRFPGAKAVQFVHTSPLHLEAMKETKRSTYVESREAKVSQEIAIASEADLVICIGPRLYRAMHDLIVPRASPAIKVRAINCGVRRDPGPFREPPLRPTILSLGRTESIEVKGLDIAAYAMGHLARLWADHPSTRTQPEPQFIVRGAKSDIEGLEQALIKCALEVGPKPTIIVRPYTSDRAELEADYRGASIFMMPSREEGFGLVACEALSLGTPTLVSASSGIAEVIRQATRINHMADDKCVIALDDDPKAAGERFARAALEILTDVQRMRGYFATLSEHLLDICSWEVGARQLLTELGVEMAASEPLLHEFSPSSTQHCSGTASLIERNRAVLFADPNVISAQVEEIIVVHVSKGSRSTQIPTHVEGRAVLIREGDPIQLTAAEQRCGGDLLVGESRSAYATILETSGRAIALTAGHAVRDARGQPIRLRLDGREHSATVALLGMHMDWAVLDVPTAVHRAHRLITQAPDVSDEVVLHLDGRMYRGHVSALDISAAVQAGGSGEPIAYNGLFQVELDGPPPVGASGSLVVAEPSGVVIGMIVAGSRSNSGKQVLYGYPIDEVLLDVAREFQVAREGVRAGAKRPTRIGILATDQITLKYAVERLTNLRRRPAVGRIYFSGNDLVSGHEITICNAQTIGNIASAISTLELIRSSSIDHLLVVGLGGGLDPQQVRIGDVVIGSDVIYYEMGVIGASMIMPRIRIAGKMNARMASLARQLAQDMHNNEQRTFKLFVGTIASGEKVIRDAGALRNMIGWSTPIVVDMESAGAFEAAGAVEAGVDVIPIRGIADLADGSKSDDGWDGAARNAVETAFALINTF